MTFRKTLLMATTAALALAPAAAAHITVHPDKVPADSFQRFSIQVPVERSVPTTRVKVQLPPGLVFVSFQPKAGWARKITMEKLATPITMEGEKITERVATVEWSGGKINPGEFDEFIMSAHVPNTPGKDLVFPAVQTYANGEVVRWIGAASSDTPAPHVTLENASGPTVTPAPRSTQSKDDDEDGSDVALWLAIAAIAASLAALGLGLVRRRRA